MKGRKGMELSVSMVVMLIISIVMFIGAIALVQNFFKEAIGVQAALSKGIDQEIQKQLRQGSILTIPVNKATVKRGKDYDKNEKNNYLDKWWVGGFAMIEEPGLLENNEFKSVAIRLKANNNMAEGVSTAPGTYVFNVCVYVTPKGFCQGDSSPGIRPGGDTTSQLSDPDALCRACAKDPVLCKQLREKNPLNYVYNDKVLKVYLEVQ